jgi:hypothetical protein
MTLGRRGPAPHSTAQASAAQVIARAKKPIPNRLMQSS